MTIVPRRRVPTKLQINLSLGRIGWAGLEKRSADAGVGLPEVVADAIAHFCSQLEGGRIATDVPRFAIAPAEAESRELVVELTRDCLGRLDREAAHQGIDLEELFAHAVMVFLADGEAASAGRRAAEQQRAGDADAIARRRRIG